MYSSGPSSESFSDSEAGPGYLEGVCGSEGGEARLSHMQIMGWALISKQKWANVMIYFGYQ